MKPSEVHALPSISSEPWHQAGDVVLQAAFDFQSWDLDTEAGAAAENPSRLEVHEKLSCALDGGRFYATVRSLVFDGVPFGIHCVAGKREDHNVFYMTDRKAFDAAFAYLLSFKRRPESFVDASKDEEVVEMTAFYGAVAVPVGDGVRMVTHDRLDENGTLVFDDVLYREAFDRILRPAYKGKDMSPGFKSAEMRAYAAQVLFEAIPDGLDKVLVDRYADGSDPNVSSRSWIGVVAATDDGTYAVVVPGWSQGSHFSWGNSISVGRIGGPETIERYRAESAPAP